MKLRIATCQFPVSSDVRRNARYVLRQMRTAKERGARVAHFCETALTGYAGVDLDSLAGLDWAAIEDCTGRILDEACRLRLWVLLGSTHRLSGRHKPHNSVYVIDARGRIVDRYDKRFCAGDRHGRRGDLAHYSPGTHLCTFSLGGVRCGVQICYDFRFPELGRAYQRRGVRLMFHSFHAGHVSGAGMRAFRGYLGARGIRLSGADTLPGITMPAAMQTAAATNYMWMSCANTSARESCWPAFTVRPDGVVASRLRRNVAGELVTEIDTAADLYDSTAVWRGRAMRGMLYSGRPVRDPRSRRRTRL